VIKTREERTFQVVANIIMALFALAAVIPVILLLISSFTSNEALVRNGYSFIPVEWSLENYEYVFLSGNKIVNAYGISFFLTAIGTVIGTVITTSLGYAISRSDLPGVKVMTFLVFFTMLFNGGLVPTYMNYCNVFQVKNTFWGLLIPSLLMNAFNVMLVKSYFKTGVPDEILEAARIDGAGELRTFASIAVPMAKPIIATIAMFVGINYWNDWNNGYIYITSATNLYSIQNLLNRMQQNIQFLVQNNAGLTSANVGLSNIPTEGVRMSMAVLGVIPIVVIYPFIQNNFVKGITLGGVKG